MTRDPMAEQSPKRYGYEPPSQPARLNELVQLARGVWEAVLLSQRTFVSVFGAIVVLSIVAVLVAPRLYKSEASFSIEDASKTNLSAAVMGIIGKLGGPMGGETPDFYADLLKSRPVLDALLRMRPRGTCDQPKGTSVLEALRVGGQSPAESLFYGRKLLAKRLTADVNLQTGVVTASIEAACPELARESMDTLLALVNDFDVNKRKTLARIHREFVEQRAREADAELRDAEDALASFLRQNRNAGSPDLKFAQDRLQRRVTMAEDIATTLRREFETARIDEVNGTPAITIVQPSSTPIEPSRPKRRVIVLAMSILAILVAVATATLRTLLHPLPPEAGPSLATLHARFKSLISPVKAA